MAKEHSENFVKDPNYNVKLNDTSKGVLGENATKLGHYSESTGGGVPLAKGEKLKDHPVHRVQQPRDDEGKFTYNSVNGKELKYGPSRGTTTPPFLQGIKLTFFQPGTKLKLDGPDGIKVKIATIDMTVEEIVTACKHYMAEEGGFLGMGEGSSITKKGKKSVEEKEAAPGQIGYVDPKTLSESTQKQMADAQAKYQKPNFNWFVPKEKPQEQPKEEPKEKPNENPNLNPVTPSGAEKKDETPTSNNDEDEILKQMGLSADDKEFDVESIKKDPKAFAQSVQFKSIWKLAKQVGIDKPGKVITAIVQGKFKNPAAAKKYFQNKLGGEK